MFRRVDIFKPELKEHFKIPTVCLPFKGPYSTMVFKWWDSFVVTLNS